MTQDEEIKRQNEKIEFLARTNMLYSDWEHRETQVTSDLIRKGIEEHKINAELQAEIERLKQRKWVGLTKEEIAEFDTWHDNRKEEIGWCNPSEIVAYIEAKLKDKNNECK